MLSLALEILIGREHQLENLGQVKKLKQQQAEEKKNYMKKCFFDHLKGKEVFMARARLQEKEEETEIKIFNEHKERMKKLMAQKKMVRPLPRSLICCPIRNACV